MATVTFDIYAFVKRLKDAGFSDEQAEALATAQKDSLAESLDTTLATKLDGVVKTSIYCVVCAGAIHNILPI